MKGLLPTRLPHHLRADVQRMVGEAMEPLLARLDRIIELLESERAGAGSDDPGSPAALFPELEPNDP